MGVRKLYELLEPFMLENQIKMGRDALFDLMAAHGLLVRRRKRKVYTTQSFHWLRKYPNLIRDFTPQAANQLWVSDITYWKTAIGFLYICFITDAYSHKVVGYQLSTTLEAIHATEALKMALTASSSLLEGLIHHSDRGIQYCSQAYVKLLQDYNIQISMSENGDPLENAVAERVNGIIKDEYLDHFHIESFSQAGKILNEVIYLYNQERPHMSIGNLTPAYIHKTNQQTEKLW